jgi:hypothetical protein
MNRRIFIGYSFRDARAGWLVYENAACAPEPLAGLLMIERAVSSPGRGESGRLAAAGCKRNFALHGRPQPSEGSPACPTSLGKIPRGGIDLSSPRRGRTRRRVLGRLRSSLNSKLLSTFPPQAVTLFLSSASRRPARTSTGQPAVLKRRVISPIRASRRVRHENCNR